jgi:hypothetical protein
MTCPGCHSEIPDQSGLCPGCGVQLAAAESRAPLPTQRLPAAELDPLIGTLLAGKASTYIQASTWIGLWTPSNGAPQSKVAAQRAIELDPALADAYVALGYARMNFDWDWAGAKQDLKRALQLSPRSSLALDGGNPSSAYLRAGRETDRLDSLAGAMREPLFWRSQTQPAVDDSQPITLRALCEPAGRAGAVNENPFDYRTKEQ